MGKGYLLILEVMFSLVLMLALTAPFISRMVYKRGESELSKIADIGIDALAILDKYGQLKQWVYTEDFESLNASLKEILPSNMNFNFYVYNQTDLIGEIINGETTGVTNNVIYFLYGNETYDPRRIDLILWYEV